MCVALTEGWVDPRGVECSGGYSKQAADHSLTYTRTIAMTSKQDSCCYIVAQTEDECERTGKRSLKGRESRQTGWKPECQTGGAPANQRCRGGAVTGGYRVVLTARRALGRWTIIGGGVVQTPSAGGPWRTVVYPIKCDREKSSCLESKEREIER